jgi:hypothetical protein
MRNPFAHNFQNLTKLASDIKADPHKAASQALAAASKQANDLLDAKVGFPAATGAAKPTDDVAAAQWPRP